MSALTVWLIRLSVLFSKHCTLPTPHGKDGWATLLGYYSHIYLETVGRVLEVRNNSSQRLVPSLRERRRTTMGHLTVMKSMGTCWQIHLEPQWERERVRERGKLREGGRDGAQEGGQTMAEHGFNNKNSAKCCLWGLFCSSKELWQRDPGFMWLTNWHSFHNITCYWTAVGQLPVTPTFPSILASSTLCPLRCTAIGPMLITVPSSLWSSRLSDRTARCAGSPGM